MKYILKELSDGVCTVTLNRAELHNAFNDEFIVELTDAFKEISTDQNIRLVVLAANGKSFCAGADLNWMKSMVNYTMEENIQDSKKLSDLFHTINQCTKPVIGKIQGAALGGGVGLVSVCDYVIASKSATFGLTEVRLGLMPAVISPFVIAKIGQSHARAWFLNGERFDARDALHMGLVHVICDAEALEEKTTQAIASFFKAAPEATAIAKDLVFSVDSMLKNKTYTDIQKYTCEQIAKRRISKEGQEGMSALLEKRKAGWLK